MLLLARGLARSHRVDLVAASAQGEFSALVPGGVRLVDLHAKRVLFSARPLVHYLRAARPEALIAAMTHCNVVALVARNLARAQTRIIATEHTELSLVAGHALRLREKSMPLAARRLYPGADAVVAVSAGVAHDIARITGAPPERTRVIYNPVLTPELFQLAEAPVEHPWFATGSPPVVLAVGRLEPQKDFATLLRAFAQLRRRRDARLLILGEGSQRGALERLQAELGLKDEAQLPGFCPNPFPYMKRAALLALSSQWEGLGLVLVEALALGTAVVATDCRSGPREILQDGRLGRLVPAGDADALAAAIEATLASPPPPATEADLRPFYLENAVQAYHELIVALTAK